MQGVPPGHAWLARPGTTVVARSELAEAVRDAMQAGSLYEWAASHPERRALTGRLPVYAAPLPGGTRIVVRRNAHGGWLASWRRDRFVRSRAPYELDASLALAELGVPTTIVACYALYRLNVIESAADVATLELPPGRDLASALLDTPAAEAGTAIWPSVRSLLLAMARQGVWHQDLNVKNIYVASSGAAVLLDVDRVRFTDPGRGVAQLNTARLLRSLNKLAVARGARLSATELAAIDVAREVS